MSLLRRTLLNSSASLVRYYKTDAPGVASSSRNTYRRDASSSNDFEEGSSRGSPYDKYAHRKTPAEFLKHREAMKEQFPNGWNPPRKLSREAMDGLRTLHTHDPQTFTTAELAGRFRISPEAVRRILKSKWLPNKDEKAKMLEKDRRRKAEYIAKSVEKEKAAKWAQYDGYEKSREPRQRREWDDGFTLV